MKTLLETMTIYWLSTSKNKNETTLHGAKSDIWQESIIQHLFNVGRCKLHLPTYSHNFDPQIKMCVYESCLTNLTYILTLWLSTLIQYVINIGAFCMSKKKRIGILFSCLEISLAMPHSLTSKGCKIYST